MGIYKLKETKNETHQPVTTRRSYLEPEPKIQTVKKNMPFVKQPEFWTATGYLMLLRIIINFPEWQLWYGILFFKKRPYILERYWNIYQWNYTVSKICFKIMWVVGGDMDETWLATCWQLLKEDEEYTGVHYTSLSTFVHGRNFP